MNPCVRFAVRIVGIIIIVSMFAWAPTAFAQADDVAASPDAQMILPVAGTWTGSINTDQDGSGDLTLTINQNKKKLTGNFTTDISGGHSGPLKGNVSGDVVKINMVDTEGGNNCKVKIMATVSGSEMSGAVLVHGGRHCKGTGTIALTLPP